MKQIIYTISLILLLGACTDEKYTDMLSSEGARPGELVPVKLALNTLPIQSPLSSGTKAGDDVVRSTLVCKGMEISLVGTPVTRSMTYEDEIKNYCVLQFGGTTPESKLILKQFIPGNSVKEVLLTQSTTGKKDRIIVIANAGETAFNDLEENSSTLAEFENKAIGYNESSQIFPQNFPLLNIGTGGTIPFTGSTDMIVTANKQADIMLYRSVARAKVNLSLSAEMQHKGYTAWSYQFMSIPKKSFYYSIGRTAAFPGDAVGYANYAPGQITSFPTTITTNLPVNLHHSVPYTTQEKRATNAPTGATYLQLMGMLMNGNIISQSVVYQIHLGSNFTDDYSISPNYSYTYNINITGESDDDSRVIKFIPGYFGGALKMYKDGVEAATPSQADTWRYEKRIEVYIKDVNDEGGVKWWNGTGSMPLLQNDFMDGRQNTWDLKDKVAYPAMQKCIGLNGALATIDDMIWYMPSYGQSLGIYVAGSNTLKSLPNTTYWSSTANAAYAWGTQVWSGQSSQISPTTLYSLRCVKNLEQNDMVQ